jgi:hypothetical protein
LAVSTGKRENRSPKTDHAASNRQPYRVARVHGWMMLDATAYGNLDKTIGAAARFFSIESWVDNPAEGTSASRRTRTRGLRRDRQEAMATHRSRPRKIGVGFPA